MWKRIWNAWNFACRACTIIDFLEYILCTWDSNAAEIYTHSLKIKGLAYFSVEWALND